MFKKIILFTILGLLAACSAPAPKKDTTPKVPTTPLDGLKIAYYSNDSVKKYFDYFKREEAAAESNQKRFENQLKKRNKAYEDYIIKKDQEARAGLLSQNEIAMVQQKAQQMQNELLQFQQTEGQRIEEQTMKSLEAINKKVELWGKKYSEKHHIDLLLIQGQGGQINYINKSMDVTKAFINFLNENQSKIEKEL
ncbi:MAG: OmpH family outer membrane protein [Flavobacteriales bacterium]